MSRVAPYYSSLPQTVWQNDLSLLNSYLYVLEMHCGLQKYIPGKPNFFPDEPNRRRAQGDLQKESPKTNKKINFCFVFYQPDKNFMGGGGGKPPTTPSLDTALPVSTNASTLEILNY